MEQAEKTIPESRLPELEGRTGIPAERIEQIQAYWRAANYLSVIQIYLRDNTLLSEPLQADHIKPRLLGHFGTTPGLNLIWAHLNRLICDTHASVLFVCGPGHGAPAVLSNLCLEGTLSEYHHDFTQDRAGIHRLAECFSWPGGMPSHVTPLTPGAVHEGGELGYSLAHAFGAAFDNPDLMVACVIGDGEAETGPLAASWNSHRFLNPASDGAVLPILHLNGYKISGPTVLGRMKDEELKALFGGYGYSVCIVSEDDQERIHYKMWQAMDWAYATVSGIKKDPTLHYPIQWPLIIMRTPKGWTAPAMLDGKPLEGTFRSHQVPIKDVPENKAHLALLEKWLRSYEPENLFDDQGRAVQKVSAVCPPPHLRMGKNPHAFGGDRLVPLNLPDPGEYAVPVATPGKVKAGATGILGEYLRDVFRENKAERNFRIVCPDETESNRLSSVFEETDRTFVMPISDQDEGLSPGGRVMEVLSEHLCQGWLEGYLLTGRHGLFTSYEAFITIVDSMVNQHAKWLKVSREIPWRTPVASLNYLLTSHSWRQDHNGYSHQGPGFINTLLTKKSSVVRIYLPPDANCLLSVMAHCLQTRNYVNLVVASKQAMPQWLNSVAAQEHCRRGASIWQWASSDDGDPDVILAAAGDIPTQETVAAAWLLRQEIPDVKVRVVNVVDLLTLESHRDHPHGLDEDAFEELFTRDKPVVFSFHGYPRVIHELVYHRSVPSRFHVRGYIEEGTTTTPFDMVVCNQMSRYHIGMEALRRVPKLRSKAGEIIDDLNDRLTRHRQYIQEHGEDMPEVTEWSWS